MRVITLARVKELLLIPGSDYDDALNLAIPIVDSAVKQITKNRWNYRVSAGTTNASTTVSIVSIISPIYYNFTGNFGPLDDIDEYVQTGQLIEGTGMPTGAYISEVFYNYPEGSVSSDISTLQVTISSAATATGSSVALYLGIPIAYQMNIAKGVWWMKSQMSTTIEDNSWTSKSMGPISVTKGQGSQRIDNASGMPLWFVQALPKFMSGH